jgi:hypothetical protein
VLSVGNSFSLAWTFTVEVDMAFWCALNKHTHTVTNRQRWRIVLGVLGVTWIFLAVEMVLFLGAFAHPYTSWILNLNLL